MGEEITVIKEQHGRSGRNETKHESLLSILHDKNKVIEKMQRQLHFQKLQLKYYLGKTFRNEKVVEFSNACNPMVVEENVPITFAVNRFCLQVGIKSKIIVLYERMSRIDGRINNLLRIQEYLLRKVVEKICEMVKKEKGLTVQLQIRNMISKPECVHLFNNLMNACIGLRKNLDTFRICCDRLLIIEEERNSIAEQVYSLPIDQRNSCHYLIGIQIEKVQLQNRLKEILKDQNLLRNRLQQLNEIETELRNLQEEYKLSNKNCTEHMTDMLRRVNFEALGLIAKSNQQKEKYTNEIVKLKCENQRILKMVEHLKAFVQEKALNKDSSNLNTVFSAGFYQALDREINQAIQDNEMYKDSKVEKVRSECRELSLQLQNARNENNLLEKELENLKIEYAEARRQWQSDLEAAQREKDEYKAQVEDLQAIRAAYAQLVDSRANMSEEGSQIGSASNTKELERDNLRLSKEVALLIEETNKQKSKIRRLSEQILNLNGNYEKGPKIEELETTDVVGSGDVRTESDTLLPKTNSCVICGEKSEMERGIIIQELQRSNVSQDDINNLVHDQKLDEITTNIIQDLTSTSRECNCPSSIEPVESVTEDYGSNYLTETEIRTTPEKSVISIRGINFEVTNSNSETTLQIHSPREDDQDKIRNIMGKTEKLGDLIKIKDNSLVSVKVRYVSPKHTNHQNSRSVNLQENHMDLIVNEDIESSMPRVKPVVKFKALENSCNVSQKEEVKALKVTYRNPHDNNIDSDQATEPHSGEMENSGEIEVKEVKLKLRAIADKQEVAKIYSIPSPHGVESRSKSLGDLR